MNILLKTTFLIIIGFSILNLALSLWFYYTTKLKLHALQAGFWLSLVFNFFIQGSASDAGVGQVILSYGFSIVPVTFLSIISFKIAEVKFPKKVYGILYSFLVLLNLILLNFSIPFFWKSLPISLAISIPLFHSSYNLLIKNIGSRTAFQRLMGIILFLNGVNGINFAIFRMEPGAQLWGWIVAYALYQLIAVFLPALSLEFHNRTERERLSKMVEDKTRNLSHANAKLDSVHRQNSILLKVLLHDISNSIQVMSFQISKLGNKFPIKQQGQSNNPEVLSKLEDRLKMLFNLIQQVKEYESVKTGKSELKKEKVTLSEVREEINARFKEQMSAKNLEFVFIADAEDQEPYICADRSSFFNSILSNLVSNAIKFSPVGEKIIVKMFSDDQCNCIKISNSGEPIPNVLIPKLFSFDEKTTRPGTKGEGGSGFGLPILREYMCLHNGEVTVESVGKSANGTTTFSLTFPKIEGYAV